MIIGLLVFAGVASGQVLTVEIAGAGADSSGLEGVRVIPLSMAELEAARLSAGSRHGEVLIGIGRCGSQAVERIEPARLKVRLTPDVAGLVVCLPGFAPAVIDDAVLPLTDDETRTVHLLRGQRITTARAAADCTGKTHPNEEVVLGLEGRGFHPVSLVGSGPAWEVVAAQGGAITAANEYVTRELGPSMLRRRVWLGGGTEAATTVPTLGRWGDWLGDTARGSIRFRVPPGLRHRRLHFRGERRDPAATDARDRSDEVVSGEFVVGDRAEEIVPIPRLDAGSFDVCVPELGVVARGIAPDEAGALEVDLQGVAPVELELPTGVAPTSVRVSGRRLLEDRSFPVDRAIVAVDPTSPRQGSLLLAPGRYELRIQMPGYVPIRPAVNVSGNRDRLDLRSAPRAGVIPLCKGRCDVGEFTDLSVLALTPLVCCQPTMLIEPGVGVTLAGIPRGPCLLWFVRPNRTLSFAIGIAN